MLIKPLSIIGMVALLCFSCSSKGNKKAITHTQDYDSYLQTKLSKTKEEAQSLVDFWSNRLDADTTGVGDIAPLAGAYSQLFAATGTMEYLRNAEILYQKGMRVSANNKDVFARALARNYITQHRFKEAHTILTESFNGISNKHETQLMLFDTSMEIGDYKAAYKHLNAVKNFSDYNYLIRLSKWSDYKGDLDSAIQFMEDAKTIAESRDSKPLKIWTYSNLADYYGHAGRIEEAYLHYLKTLELQPDNYHVKKGIAWILYSKEQHTTEAHRILDSLIKQHSLPDYLLLKSELFEFEGDMASASLFQEKFIKRVDEGGYDTMYNTYLIEMLAKTNPKQALLLAQEEVNNRATPETYQCLAYAQLKNGNPTLALATIEQYVAGKTEEPMALYYTALVYKANNKQEQMLPLKEELLDASFEIGPVLYQEVQQL